MAHENYDLRDSARGASADTSTPGSVGAPAGHATAFPEVGALPSDATLLHIGPRKSGTTAIQSAFSRGRADTLEQGVRYPGDRLAQSQALRSLGNVFPEGNDEQNHRLGEELMAELADWPGRTLLSAEVLEHADPNQIRQLVGALDRPDLHVLITARPISKQLPSLWQQLIKRGKSDQELTSWLEELLTNPDDPQWHGQRVDRLADRWGEIVGPERVHVTLIDPDRPEETIATVERLLALPPYALKPGRSNRGMTLLEADLARSFRLVAADREPSKTQSRKLDLALNRFLAARQPDAAEAYPKIPEALRHHAETLQSEVATNLADSQHHLIGDLETWRQPREQDFSNSAETILDLRDDRHDPLLGLLGELLDSHATQEQTKDAKGITPSLPEQSTGPDSPERRSLLGRLSRRLNRPDDAD